MQYMVFKMVFLYPRQQAFKVWNSNLRCSFLNCLFLQIGFKRGWCRLQCVFKISAVGYSMDSIYRRFNITALGSNRFHTIVSFYFHKNMNDFLYRIKGPWIVWSPNSAAAIGSICVWKGEGPPLGLHPWFLFQYQQGFVGEGGHLGKCVLSTFWTLLLPTEWTCCILKPLWRSLPIVREMIHIWIYLFISVK
jgi:hypothetical protein